jgi:hypothetical protein
MSNSLQTRALSVLLTLVVLTACGRGGKPDASPPKVDERSRRSLGSGEVVGFSHVGVLPYLHAVGIRDGDSILHSEKPRTVIRSA